MGRQTRAAGSIGSSDEARAGLRSLDLDQDYCARAVGNLVTACLLPDEGASLKTLRQYLPGDDVIQLAIRLGFRAFLISWTFVRIRPLVLILLLSTVRAV